MNKICEKEFQVKRIFTATIMALGFTFLGVSPGKADVTKIERAFILADKDGDDLVGKPEFIQVVMTHFSKTDTNKNNLIEKGEIGDLAKNPEFSDGDANKDGSLSVEEVIAEKLQDFKAADTNKDGALNVDEAMKFYKDKNKK